MIVVSTHSYLRSCAWLCAIDFLSAAIRCSSVCASCATIDAAANDDSAIAAITNARILMTLPLFFSPSQLLDGYNLIEPPPEARTIAATIAHVAASGLTIS